MGTRIKICGITSVADAVAVARLGADEIGLNFYRPSPRFVGLAKAREIALAVPPTVRKVGVFVNSSPEAVLSYAHFVGLDAIQLHGDESADFVRKIRNNSDCFLIKAVRANAMSEISLPTTPVDAFLIDSPHSGEYGGTGEPFDWSLVEGTANAPTRMYIAGGLGPENVASAVRLLQPFAVDACSRLESAKGRKDLGRVEEFIQEVRRAQ